MVCFRSLLEEYRVSTTSGEQTDNLFNASFGFVYCSKKKTVQQNLGINSMYFAEEGCFFNLPVGPVARVQRLV